MESKNQTQRNKKLESNPAKWKSAAIENSQKNILEAIPPKRNMHKMSI